MPDYCYGGCDGGVGVVPRMGIRFARFLFPIFLNGSTVCSLFRFTARMKKILRVAGGDGIWILARFVCVCVCTNDITRVCVAKVPLP